MGEIVLNTTSQIELVDITAEINNLIYKSQLNEGICVLFVPHTTAALIISENEQGLIHDLLFEIKRFFPERNYEHDIVDNNAKAHLTSTLLGQNLVVPFSAGRLSLGTWQAVFLVELDGPRKRQVVVTLRE